MMKSIVLKPMQHIVRRGQVGQSIVIVALGFLGLLGFVGIVTDVSLMFVRFSSLRRAVDSAAVGAASQIRRLPEPAGGPDGEGIARNIAQANLAARQLIQFHGLDPTTVLVQTCATERGQDAELCTDEQRKLVRVTAQIESPTIFMRLLGFSSLTLEASAISETAALDVVMILDVSESMLNETTYEEWAEVGLGVVPIPKRIQDVAPGPARFVEWGDLTNEAWTTGQGNVQFTAKPQYTPDTINPFVGSHGAQALPRPECQVRFFPGSVRQTLAADVMALPGYQALWGGGGDPQLDGFAPTYNFYGCCNDPNGDGLFADLVCQPFRDARDAAEDFLGQIDFIRGDRVAFVTFDRSAFLVRVDQDDVFNLDPNNTQRVTHMIDAEDLALQVLQNFIGVRTEPNFYEPTCFEQGGTATCDFRDNVDDASDDVDAAIDLPMVPWTGFANEDGALDYDNDLNLHDYPTFGSCRFQDAELPPPFGTGTLQATRYAPPPAWAEQDDFYSYELWAQCRGTNIGGALASAGAALTDPLTTRSAGAVWTMVLLSDGAAGGTDPVRRNGVVPQRAEPYRTDAGGNPDPGPGQYGAYGACPYGDPNDGIQPSMTRLGINENPNTPPHCLDNIPESRHFCDTLSNDDTVIDLEIGGVAQGSHCFDQYDADDYARDWAEFVGLDNSESGNLQLPTIFTIGFGLGFPNGSGSCSNNIPDCLGEELLRYIADVGDNFQVDTDYQQLFVEFAELGPVTVSGFEDWGPRGPCEGDVTTVAGTFETAGEAQRAGGLTYNDLINPLDPTENCGNYFNATTDQASLALVFDEIASRMFTRIAR